VVTEEQSGSAVSVDVSRLRIACQARPAQAHADDVRMENVELPLPENLTVVGVQAHDAFLLSDFVADAVDDEHTALHDDRGGTAAIRRLPDQVVTGIIGIRGPACGQADFRGHASLPRAAPVGPVGGAGADGEQGQDQKSGQSPETGGTLFHGSNPHLMPAYRFAADLLKRARNDESFIPLTTQPLTTL